MNVVRDFVPGPRTAAFTLLEVLVAVAVVGVALVSLLGLHARDVRLTARAQDVTIAGLLAARLAADLRSHGQAELGEASGVFDQQRSGAASDDRPFGGPLSAGLSWQRNVELTGLLNLYRVHVEVARDGERLAELDFLLPAARP